MKELELKSVMHSMIAWYPADGKTRLTAWHRHEHSQFDALF